MSHKCPISVHHKVLNQLPAPTYMYLVLFLQLWMLCGRLRFRKLSRQKFENFAAKCWLPEWFLQRSCGVSCLARKLQVALLWAYQLRWTNASSQCWVLRLSSQLGWKWKPDFFSTSSPPFWHRGYCPIPTWQLSGSNACTICFKCSSSISGLQRPSVQCNRRRWNVDSLWAW